MPVIASFDGIVIKMYFAPGEHNPPHFHAYYNDYAAAFDIRTRKVLDGNLPGKQKALVVRWASAYRERLMKIWETQEFERIPPLK